LSFFTVAVALCKHYLDVGECAEALAGAGVSTGEALLAFWFLAFDTVISIQLFNKNTKVRRRNQSIADTSVHDGVLTFHAVEHHHAFGALEASPIHSHSPVFFRLAYLTPEDILCCKAWFGICFNVIAAKSYTAIFRGVIAEVEAEHWRQRILCPKRINLHHLLYKSLQVFL